jgi:hypothetical protein
LENNPFCVNLGYMKTISPEDHEMAARKRSTSMRLSEECRRMVARLCSVLGVSQSGVMEMAVRRMFRAELPNEEPPAPEPPKRKKK